MVLLFCLFNLFSNTETNDRRGSACCKGRKRRATGTSRPSQGWDCGRLPLTKHLLVSRDEFEPSEANQMHKLG